LCRALLRDREEAADAKQQTFLSAQRALIAGTEPREPMAWLATIARNECLQRIRVRMRSPLSVADHEVPDARSDVHVQAAARTDAAALWTEIKRLPQQQRDAVILREFAGLSYEELAAALGVSQGAVESLLFRARTRLRQELRSVAASLNLAGAGSWIAETVVRLVGSGGAPPVGGAPFVAKAVAATIGAVALGGAGVAVERSAVSHRPAERASAVRLPAVMGQAPARSSAAVPLRADRGSARIALTALQVPAPKHVARVRASRAPTEGRRDSGESRDGSDDVRTVAEPEDRSRPRGASGGSSSGTSGGEKSGHGSSGSGDEDDASGESSTTASTTSSSTSTSRTTTTNGGEGSGGHGGDGDDKAVTAVLPVAVTLPVATTTSSDDDSGRRGG
jgi:RNA polymerase sigma factor (sigma-70 family)